MLLSDSNKIGYVWFIHHISHSLFQMVLIFKNFVQICRRSSASMGLSVHFFSFQCHDSKPEMYECMYIYVFADTMAMSNITH